MYHAMKMEEGVEVWLIIPEVGTLYRLVVSVKPRQAGPLYQVPDT
jgi:hypothetical protein